MLAYLWSLVDASFRRSDFFVLRLPVWPFSGLVGEADSTPIFIWYVYHDWHLTLIGIYFIFTGYSPTPFIFEEIFKDSAPFLGVPFNLLMDPAFLEVFPKVVENFLRELLIFFRPIFSEVSALASTGWWYLTDCLAVFWRNYHPF